MSRRGVLEEWEWNVIRRVVYWVLLDLDGRIQLPIGRRVPKNIEELYFFARGLTFEFQLDETLELTREALLDAAESLAAAHRAAAAVQVNAPTAEQVDALNENLGTISRHFQRDQRFKAAVSLAGSVANIIKVLT